MRTPPAAAGVAGIAGIAAAAVVVRRRWMVVTVVGDSMLPALRPGDVLLARRGGTLGAGDVVVLAPPDGLDAPVGPRPGPHRTWLVKRVAALPGQPVPWTPAATVPPGTVAVRGDNGGHDSRTFGPLPVERVLARVVRRIRAAGPTG